MAETSKYRYGSIMAQLVSASTVWVCFLCVSPVSAQWAASGSNIYNTNIGQVGIKTSTPGPTLEVAGTVGLSGNLFLPNFTIDPDGRLTWNNTVQMAYGGNGEMRIYGLQNNVRTALEFEVCSAPALIPLGPLDEITSYRRSYLSETNYDRISWTAMNGDYRIQIETGSLYGPYTVPLVFRQRRGSWFAEGMRMTEDGRMNFGWDRTGPRTPMDILALDQIDPTLDNRYIDSDFLLWTGRSMQSAVQPALKTMDWKVQTDVYDPFGNSAFVLRYRKVSDAFTKKIEINDRGDVFVYGGTVELSSLSGGVVLRSPNGNYWKITVDNTGTIQSTPWTP